MNASSTTPLDTAVNKHGSFKGFNYPLAESNYTGNSSSLASKCDKFKRYSRTKLFDLRNDSYSRRRPEKNLQAELQSLGIWKFNSGANVYQNGVSPSSEAAIVSSLSGGSHSVQVSSTHLRSQRSPSRRDQNTAVNINSSSQHNLSHHSLHKSYIDHRSISSSHLMPAFAKRRIAASSTTTSNATGMVSQNLPGSGNSSYGPNSPVDTRSQTPTDVKDGILCTSISAGNNGHIRQRTKDKLYEYRHSASAGSSNVGDDPNILFSPQRKVLAEHDRDRDQELQSSNGCLSSPVSSGSARHSHNSVGLAHERRIGSGRLLPRDVSWDYRTAQDRDKSQILNSVTTIDKEAASNHLGQTRGGRYTERTNDRTSGGGNGFTERRQFDHRGGGNDDNIRDKYEQGISTNSPSAHSGVTRKDIYGPESSSSQHIVSHNRNRRNHQYNERNEEPEWFSGGPTSQHDTIELRGFEEIDDHYNAGNSRNPGNNKRSAFSSSSRKMSECSSSRASSTMNLSSSKSKEHLHGSVDQDKEVNCTPRMSQNNLPSSNTENVDPPNEEEKNSSFEGGDSNNNSSEITQRKKTANEGSLPDFLLEKEGTTPKASSNSRINTRDTEFNFDVFLNPNLDPLKHSLMRGDNSNGNINEIMGSSRFSRWFGNKNGSTDTQSSAGSNNDNSIATESVQDRGVNKDETNTLMEFLNKLPSLPDSSVSQKVTTITSVEELEARMRGTNSGNGISTDPTVTRNETPINKPQGRPRDIILPIPNEQCIAGQPQAGEIEAFKKLLEQLGSGNKHHAQPQQHLLPTNLQLNVLLPPQNHTSPLPTVNIIQPGTVMAQHMVIKNDELKKIMHPQSAFHQHNQNNGDMSNVSQPQLSTLSILFGNQPQKHAEARHLYQCITRGEVSIHFLEQELNNPNASPHAKEVIAAVLREMNTGVVSISNAPQNHAIPGPIGTQPDHSPLQLCSSNGTPISNQALTNSSTEPLQHQLSQQISTSNVILCGQTERISLLPSHQLPLNPQVMPSQRELQFHTQTIMQNAMLKKKIEEQQQQQQQQQDSLRRRPEIQKQPQPNMLSVLNELDIPQKNVQQVPNSNSMQQQQIAGTQQHTHISHAMQQQHQQSRHIHSPTPLAFTPTSVLRKMTAEKDNANTTTTHSTVNTVLQQQNKCLAQNSFINCQTTQQMQQQQPITTHPRMILGGTNSSQQHQQMSVVNNQLPTQSTAQAAQQQSMQSSRNTLVPMKWPLHLVNQNMTAIKPMGRPILKGPLPPPPSSQQHQSQQQMQQQISQLMFNKLDFQQMQQRLKNNQSHVLSQTTPPFPQHTIAPQQASSHTNIITHVQQQQQHLYQHQQRALALQRHQQQQVHLQQQLQKQQQQQHQQQQSIDNMCLSSSLVGESSIVSNNAADTAAAAAVNIINYRDGCLSPTSNQLAQWFSPELLAQASAGKLPLLNMNQTLSLEEFEKNMQHSSTTVHN